MFTYNVNATYSTCYGYGMVSVHYEVETLQHHPLIPPFIKNRYISIKYFLQSTAGYFVLTLWVAGVF